MNTILDRTEVVQNVCSPYSELVAQQQQQQQRASDVEWRFFRQALCRGRVSSSSLVSSMQQQQQRSPNGPFPLSRRLDGNQHKSPRLGMTIFFLLSFLELELVRCGSLHVCRHLIGTKPSRQASASHSVIPNSGPGDAPSFSRLTPQRQTASRHQKRFDSRLSDLELVSSMTHAAMYVVGTRHASVFAAIT